MLFLCTLQTEHGGCHAWLSGCRNFHIPIPVMGTLHLDFNCYCQRSAESDLVTLVYSYWTHCKLHAQPRCGCSTKITLGRTLPTSAVSEGGQMPRTRAASRPLPFLSNTNRINTHCCQPLERHCTPKLGTASLSPLQWQAATMPPQKRGSSCSIPPSSSRHSPPEAPPPRGCWC